MPNNEDQKIIDACGKALGWTVRMVHMSLLSEVCWVDSDGNSKMRYDSWNPLKNNDDCLKMCFALGIGTGPFTSGVRCSAELKSDTGKPYFDSVHREFLEYHDFDIFKAWRTAACKVAVDLSEKV